MVAETLNQVRSRIDAILRDPAVRAAQLSIFAESLSYIHDYRPSGWLIHLRRDRIRLLSGGLIVLTLEADEVWLAIDAAGDTDSLSKCASWTWDATSYPEYKRPSSRNGYYKPSSDHDQEWQQIRVQHFAYLDRLLARGRVFDPRSVARHEPLVSAYLSEVLQRTMPFRPSVQIPEELPLSGRYWEGEGTHLVVNRFERDRAAREECLRRQGGNCVVCDMSFGQRYGSQMEGLIHVHHLVPLSEIREGYSPDPSRDLVPVCPNCHLVIHARGATRTIEEVRAMLMRGSDAG